MTQVPTTEEAMRLLEDAEIRLRQRDYMRHQYGLVIRDLERQRDALDRAIIQLKEMTPHD